MGFGEEAAAGQPIGAALGYVWIRAGSHAEAVTAGGVGVAFHGRFVLAVAVEGEGGAAFDLDGLGVVDGEDAVADFVLAVARQSSAPNSELDLVKLSPC